MAINKGPFNAQESHTGHLFAEDPFVDLHGGDPFFTVDSITPQECIYVDAFCGIGEWFVDCMPIDRCVINDPGGLARNRPKANAYT